MAVFYIAVRNTLRFEGGYVNNSLDKGGETNFGITKKVAEQNGFYGEMKNLSKDIAEDIYQKQYWNPLRLEEIQNQEIANYIFDMAVLHGRVKAIIFFQTALNLCGKLNIKVDGICGNKTIEAYEKIKDKNLLIKYLKMLRCNYVYKIVQNDPSQQIFLSGWLNRIF